MAVQLAANPQPLSKSQRDTIKLYTEDQESRLSKIHKHIAFMKETPTIRIRITEEALENAAVGAALGSATATSFSVWGLALNFITSPSPYALILKAALAGAFAGGLVGASVGARKIILKIEDSPEYSQWKVQAIHDKVFPIFEEFIQREDVAQGFTCPITHDLIRFPVKGRDERVYEQSEIMSWITRKEREVIFGYLRAKPNLQNLSDADLNQRINDLSANEHNRLLGEAIQALPVDHPNPEKRRENILKNFSPLRNLHYKKEDLHYDFDYHKDLFRRLKKVFNGEVNRQVREGLLVFRSDVLRTREQIGEHLIAKTAAAYGSGRITKAVFDQEVENLKRLIEIAPI